MANSEFARENKYPLHYDEIVNAIVPELVPTSLLLSPERFQSVVTASSKSSKFLMEAFAQVIRDNPLQRFTVAIKRAYENLHQEAGVLVFTTRY